MLQYNFDVHALELNKLVHIRICTGVAILAILTFNS